MAKNLPIIPLSSNANKSLVRGGSTLWLQSSVNTALKNAFFGAPFAVTFNLALSETGSAVDAVAVGATGYALDVTEAVSAADVKSSSLSAGSPNVAYRVGSYNSVTSASSPLTVNNATGHATGDLILLVLNLDGKTGTVTWPTGFTQIVLGVLTAPDGETIGIAYKFDSGSEPTTYTVTHTYGTFDSILSCTAWQNVDTTAPYILSTVAQNLANNASPITLALTGLTAVSGDALLLLGSIDSVTGSDTWSAATVSGYTTLQNQSYIWANGFIQYQESLSAGATGTINVTSTRTVGTATAGWIGYQLAFHKAAGGGGGSFSLTQAEAGSASDAQTIASLSASLSVGEAGSAADTQASSQTSVSAIIETGAASESQSAVLTALLAMAETGIAIDTQALASLSALVSIIESVTASEVQSISTLTAVLTISESGSAVDVVSAGGSFTSSIAETSSLTDAQSTALSALLSMIENGSATDAQAANNFALLAIVEAVTATNTQAASMAALLALTENASAVDTQNTALTALISLIENAIAVDIPNAGGQLSVAQTELAALAETQAAAALIGTLIAEIANANNVVASNLAAALLYAELATAAETASGSATKSSSVAEAGSAVDISQFVSVYNLNSTEFANAIDFVASFIIIGAYLTSDARYIKSYIARGLLVKVLYKELSKRAFAKSSTAKAEIRGVSANAKERNYRRD